MFNGNLISVLVSGFSFTPFVSLLDLSQVLEDVQYSLEPKRLGFTSSSLLYILILSFYST